MKIISTQPELTPSQKTGLEVLLQSRRNIFLTGGPGTGKTFLLKYFMERSPEKIPVVASTGAAAILVGGRTFHSFFGLGIMQGSSDQVVERAIKNNRLKKRLKETSTLVIDEVSMLSAPTLDCAEEITRRIRKSEEPWGGIRVIAVGDFAQLPPISRGPLKEWCFLGRAWKYSSFQAIQLTEVKRTEDKEFLEILEDIRWGNVSQRVTEFLNERLREDEADRDIPHLFPRRAQTDMFNKRRLSELGDDLKTFETEYGGDDRYVERLMKDAPVPPLLELKKGALVMIRVNDPKQRYVNGTVGTIAGMHDGVLEIDTGSRSVEVPPFTFTILDDEGEEAAYAINFPVNLAYASTIHKIQGTTLERVHLDLKALWEPGQAYVALSRARSGRAVTLMGWDAFSIKSDASVRSFYQDGFLDSLEPAPA